jgi:hypothetical protein
MKIQVLGFAVGNISQDFTGGQLAAAGADSDEKIFLIAHLEEDRRR